jgi:hypothetical protein
MSSNSERIIHQARHEFEQLVEYVTGEASQSRTTYEVELALFKRLLALGAQLLLLFFVQRAAKRPREPVKGPGGTTLAYHSLRQTTYYSVFGKVQFRRHYYHATGQAGLCPLDAELSLPPRCYSDLLRDWAEYCVTNESYGESIGVIERILGLSISKQALETGVQEDAVDVAAFYDQKAVPEPETEGSILVIQADGKGVPMVRDEPAPQTARRGKGQRRTKKKEAVVTAIYTIEPYHRTPEEVVDALMPPPVEDEAVQRLSTPPQPRRPTPVSKEVRATLDGKDTALDRLTRQVERRDGSHIQHRVALTDGDEALQNRVVDRFSEFDLVLDIIHASEYLWDSANAVLGETHPDRTPWVSEQLLLILSGNTSTVIQTLQDLAQDPSLAPSQLKALNTTIGYYQRNLPYMRYDHYLAQGWPVGTGVVEGACGHLVKDRFEQSGMRWTKAGAQPLLDLRAVRVNDDWNEYHDFRRQRQHQQLYGVRGIPPPSTESLVLKLAA